jgi:hypothetical protein
MPPILPTLAPREQRHQYWRPSGEARRSLQLLELARARTQQDESEQAAERAVTEGPEQDNSSGSAGRAHDCTARVRAHQAETELMHPTGD